MPSIVKATPQDAARIAPLFDLYRQFYDCPPDPDGTLDFIQQRLERDESTIFIAQNEAGKAVGFTQLYASFCSVQMCRIFILYDLYVAEAGRRAGVAESLMNRAKEHALEHGAGRIDLLTAHTNTWAQALYEKLGYTINSQDFRGYSLDLS